MTGEPPRAFPDGVPLMSDGAVLLRAYREEDVTRIVAQSRDAASLEFTTIPRPYDETHARAWLEAIRTGWSAEPPTTWHWAIAAAEEPQTYLGTIDLRPTGGGSAETGYGLHPDGRGRGLMARALRLLQGYVASRPDLGIETIRWRAVAGNWASRRVAWSCGFTHEGTLRAALSHPSPDGATRSDVDGWHASWRVGEATGPRNPRYVAATLAADHLVLRPWRDEDGAAMPDRLDEVAARFLPGVVPTRTTYGAWLADRREREAGGTGVAWAITEARSGAVLGGIHLFAISQDRRAGNATLGVFVLPHARGRGVFGASLDRLLEYAFAPVGASAAGGLGLARVRADADVANTASVRAMLRAGMTYVGMTREERPDTRPGFANERVDMCSFEVLASDDRAVVAEFNRRGAAGPTTLSGAGVRLREFAESDAAAVVPLMRDPEFGPEHRTAATEADARRWIVRGLVGNYRRFTLRWAICPVGDDGLASDPVGYIRAFGLDERLYSGDAEIGYMLHADARRRGLATAAARALVAYLLTPAAARGYGLRRVTAITAPDNVASQKVLAAAGLTRWFIDRQVVAPGEYGGTRSAVQGENPSPDRWRYGRVHDDPDPAAGPLRWWAAQPGE